jgi:hypothetical protein
MAGGELELPEDRPGLLDRGAHVRLGARRRVEDRDVSAGGKEERRPAVARPCSSPPMITVS